MTHQIITDRLMLRPFRDADASAMVTALSQSSVTKWLAAVPFPYTKGDALQWLGSTASDWPDVAAIEHDGQLIGSMDSKGGSIGYWLAESAWGQGFATEAAAAKIAQFFEHEAADHLNSGYFEGNARSANVLKKLGFREVARREMHNMAQNRALPHVDMRLTRADWDALP